MADTPPPLSTGVVPAIVVRDAPAAVEFYKRAFGAQVINLQHHEDGRRIMHAHLTINGGSLILNDFFPEFGQAATDPAAFTLHLALDDVDGVWQRAVDAGCTVTMPLALQFWGDRYGQVRDPFGVLWALLKHGG